MKRAGSRVMHCPFLPLPGYFWQEPRSPRQGEQPRSLRASLPSHGRNIADLPKEKGNKNKKKPHFIRVQHMSQNTNPKAAYRDNKKKPSRHTSSPAPRLSYCVWITEKKKMHRLRDNRRDGGYCRRLQCSGVLLRLSDPANIIYLVPRWIISSSRARLG